jgi:potassium efflux system protein
VRNRAATSLDRSHETVKLAAAKPRVRSGHTKPDGIRGSKAPKAHALLRCALVLFAITAASTARAAEPSSDTEPETTPTDVSIPVAQIAERAEYTDNLVRAIRTRLTPDPTITDIGQRLPATAAEIEQLNRDSVAQLAAGLTPQTLDDLRRQWGLIKDQLARWTQTVGARTQAVEEDGGRLKELDETWAKMEVSAQRNALPDALRDPIRSARQTIRDTQAALVAQRNTLLALLGRISSLQTLVSDALGQLDVTEQRMRRDLFTAEAPPLWATAPAWRAQPITVAVRAGLLRNRNLLRAFVQQQSGRLVLHAVLFVLILVTTITLSRHVEQRAAADAFSAPVVAVLSRPVSSALVLTLLLGFVLHRYAPILVASVVGVLAIAPIVRLFSGPAAPQIRRSLLVLAVLLAASTLRRVLPPFLPFARVILLAQTVGGMAAAFVALHPARLATLDLSTAWRRSLTLARRGMLVLLALAVVGNLAGNVTIAILFTDGVLGATITAVAFLSTARVLEALFIALIRSESAQYFRSIASHTRPLRRRGVRIIRVLMALLWLAATLQIFGLLSTFLQAIQQALAAPLTIGAVTLTLADLVTVILTIWISFLIARLVRVVLEEDALPHMSLPRGVPAAISVGVNYLILLIGFVFALSAAGVDPSRVTLIAGALGVGIGFGLQTIVNNFVSGIILLFERPIQIGDIISFGDMHGQVRRIGFRSSTIATFDGAEVVVPNGTLVSEQVVNWTLSNYQRRVEVKVGVAYGNDPTAVIAVLEAAVKAIPEVLEQPTPRVLFAGFGDSSLDFLVWAWTDHQDMLAPVRSRIAVTVHDALRTAGIEIPFPQRDLHVRSGELVVRTPSGGDEDKAR